MRLARPRFTVRRMMVGVAVVGIGLVIYRELDEGLPPRFVIRGVPARMARLRAGMSEAQVRETLGLDIPWWRGGIGGEFNAGEGTEGWHKASFMLRPWKGVAPNGGGELIYPPQPTIILRFRHEGEVDSDPEDFGVFDSAYFLVGGKIVAVTPRTIPERPE